MLWEGGGRVLVVSAEYLQQPRQVRHVADEQHAACLTFELIAHPRCWVVRQQAPHHSHRRERITGFPEQLRRLSRPQLAAVPDDIGLHAALGHCLGEACRIRTPSIGERPHGIDVRRDGVRVVDKVDGQGGILSRFVGAAISPT